MRESLVVRTKMENGISTAENPLLDVNTVPHYIDFRGFPAKRSSTGCWKSAYFIISVEVAERFAYYGISSNLISYLTGPLGQSTATAAENVNIWNGVALLLPLVGAFIADSFLGRYRMIIISSLLYILGLGCLSLSAALPSDGKNGVKSILFFISLYLIALAQGGHKPCLQAFGADQFDEEYLKENKAKGSFFNWWCFALTIGSFAAILVLSFIEEDLSWELGFGIPCIVMCFAFIVFLFGFMNYRYHINSDKRNPFMRIGRVFINATINWQSDPTTMYSEDEFLPLMSHKDAKFKFLDKALYTRDGSIDVNICRTNDIEDAKALLRLIPIWFACLGYAIVISQVSTLFIKQGATLDRSINSSLQIPSAAFQCITSISILVFLIIYDRIFVPVTRTITKKPAGISMLQRIGSGMFLSFIVMIIAALVEMKRLSTANEFGLVNMPNATIPMSAWWLAPQYVLLGVSEVFTIVGLQEFFYDQVPKELKSAGTALDCSIFGIGNFLSSFLISVIEKVTSADGSESWFSNNLNRAHLDYFYWLLAGVSLVSTIVFVYFAKAYVYNRKCHW